ncbi:MAG: P-II family nitrogen regulator [Gemmatimonadota bacterium]
MRMILAYVPPHRLDRVTRALRHVAHLPGLTVTDARGFGREKVEAPDESPAEELMDFTPMSRLEVVAHDEQVDEIVNAIVESSYTGNRGDGKIFVLPVERAFRIKTKQSGSAAV